MHPLQPGAIVSFGPGVVHRAVNDGDLEVLVLMSNAGLPEAGDAVLTFPASVLADPAAYRAAATLPGAGASDDEIAAAARRRRDLALEGYAQLGEAVDRVGAAAALKPLHDASTRIVRTLVPRWQDVWTRTVYAETETTAGALEGLIRGVGQHLARGSVTPSTAAPARAGTACADDCRPGRRPPELAPARRPGRLCATIGSPGPDRGGHMNVEQQRFSRVDRFMRNKGPAEILYGALVSGSSSRRRAPSRERRRRPARDRAGVRHLLARARVRRRGRRPLRGPRPRAGHRLKHALRNSTGVLLGSLPVLVVFAVGRLLGLDVDRAAFIALWFTVAMLAAVAALAATGRGSEAALIG